MRVSMSHKNMSTRKGKLKSKCHGAKVEFSKWGMTTDGENIYYSGWLCSKCKKPCETK